MANQSNPDRPTTILPKDFGLLGPSGSHGGTRTSVALKIGRSMLTKIVLALMFFVLKKAAAVAFVGCVLGTIAWWGFPSEFWSVSNLLMNSSGLFDFENWSMRTNDLIEQALDRVPLDKLSEGGELKNEFAKKS